MPRAQSYNFHARLRGCFRATAASGAGANDADLEKAIKKAEFVKSEVEALIFLKKYRQSKSSHLPWAQRGVPPVFGAVRRPRDDLQDL